MPSRILFLVDAYISPLWTYVTGSTYHASWRDAGRTRVQTHFAKENKNIRTAIVQSEAYCAKKMGAIANGPARQGAGGLLS